MKLRKITSQKKGIGLGNAFGAVLALVLVATLVVIAIYMFAQLGDSFTAGSAEANATDDLITQFANYPTLVGLVGTIIFLGLVIGVLVGSFVTGGRRV